MTGQTDYTAASATVRIATTVASVVDRSIDDLDHEILRLARQTNAETYRMLALVRDFDERFGFAKWGFPSCAEWLAWRCGLSRLEAAAHRALSARGRVVGNAKSANAAP